MFSNIGGKIKKLAMVVCWLGIIGSVIYAIVVWANARGYTEMILLGFGVLVFGCLLSWIGSFFTYGFGELIERTVSIDEQLKNGGSRGSGSRAESLRKLRDEGLITEEEYRDKLNNR